jgi:Ni,Fe-hydrogenase I cytochrome b subunit
MLLFDVSLHMLLVYCVLFVIFLVYGKNEVAHRVQDIVIANMKSVLASKSVPENVRMKLLALGIPSTCHASINQKVTMQGLCILLVFVCILIASLLVTDVNLDELKQVLIQNAIIFVVVVLLELLFIKFVILKYTVITTAEIEATLREAVTEELQRT